MINIYKNKKDNFLIKKFLILTIFWFVYCSLLIIGLYLFINEKKNIDNKYNINEILKNINLGKIKELNKIENEYKKLINIKYPLIDFSLLSFNFLNKNENTIEDFKKILELKNKNISLAYSYIFIDVLISLIGLFQYIIIIFKIYKQKKIEKKYKLNLNFINNYIFFNKKIYLDFTINLTIIFSFFNFLTTILTIIYGLFLIIISYLIKFISKKENKNLIEKKWWKSKNFNFFIWILFIQNIYTFIKQIFEIKLKVNLDLILQLLFPIGTTTVIIALFIKNMLSTNITSIKNEIKNIEEKIEKFNYFYCLQKEKCLEDYNFVSNLPLIIKNYIKNEKNLNNKQNINILLKKIYKIIIFFEKYFNKNEKEKKYILWYLFNIAKTIEEMNEIKKNIKILNIIKNKKINFKKIL